MQLYTYTKPFIGKKVEWFQRSINFYFFCASFIRLMIAVLISWKGILLRQKAVFTFTCCNFILQLHCTWTLFKVNLVKYESFFWNQNKWNTAFPRILCFFIAIHVALLWLLLRWRKRQSHICSQRYGLQIMRKLSFKLCCNRHLTPF